MNIKRIFLLIISLFILSACDNDKKEEVIDNIEKDIIKIAINIEPDSFDPFLSAASDTEAIMFNVYEGLVGFDENGTIIQGLSDKWEISEDGLEYTFMLKEDVYFHDGSKFTSKDVLYTFNKLAGLNGEKAISSKFEIIESIEAISDNEIRIKLKKVDQSFLAKCIVFVVKEGYEENAKNPIGTGPYKFANYNPGQSVTLNINENYHSENRKGKIDKVEFLIMPDENAKINALRSGAIDMFEASKEVIDQVPDEYSKYHNYSNTVNVMALNYDIAPFDDINVRKAVNYAIDRGEISDIVVNGSGYPNFSTFSPASNGYYGNTTEVYSYDIEKAKELLKEAGYEEGLTLEITVPSNYSIHVNTAQVVVSQLEKVGIKATIKQIEWGMWSSEVYTKGNYEATMIGLTGKIDPAEITIRFHSDYSKNFFHYKNKEYDKIIESALIEKDEYLRRELYDEAQMLLLSDVAAIFLMDPGRDIACNKNLKGYKFYPVTFWDLSSLYLE